MRIATPPGFSFPRTVLSHGWFDLPPFHWDSEAGTLRRPIETGRGRAMVVEMSAAAGDGLAVSVAVAPRSGLRTSDRAAARDQVRHMLRLDESYEDFYLLCRGRDGFTWAAETGAGRLLRAPAPFEDLVKMICTTNCTWALTRVIVGAIVRDLGSPVSDGRGGSLSTFPSAKAMAEARPSYYVRTAKAGYRADYLSELSRRVAAGKLDPSRWLDPAMPIEEIRAEIGSVKGAGRYVVDNMMKLLGRYDGLGIDSWCRRKFSEMHRNGRAVTDRAIEKHYAPFGRWRGLALWCDITRDWFEDGKPIVPNLLSQKY